LVNTLAAYFIEICKKLNDQDTIEIHGQEQSSKDLLTKVAQWLNEMEQISKSEKFTFINKGF
jgi:hypothetical protein